MRRATEILLQRARDGVRAAIADLELSEAQVKSAGNLETMEALDLLGDFRRCLITLDVNERKLSEMLAAGKVSVL